MTDFVVVQFVPFEIVIMVILYFSFVARPVANLINILPV